MGISADSSTKAFPSADVERFLMERPRVKIPVDIMEDLSRSNTRHFVLAVDPSGGGSSAFAVSSMVQLPRGEVVVRYALLSPPSLVPRNPVPSA